MQSIRTGNKELIREINVSLILFRLRAEPLLSRTDLARRTGLSLPTVSEIVAELLRRGIVEEREVGRSAGGRRPVLLAVKPDAGYVVGIKITESRVIAVLTDLDASVVEHTTTSFNNTAVAAVVEAVADTVTALRAVVPAHPVFGVGVGLAGVVDRMSGVVRHATYAEWRDVKLAELLQARIGLPVVVDNDVNTLAASEQLFGAGRGVGDVAVVTVGRGVGLGMVLGGRIYRGAAGGAGEFGHIKVAADGPVCPCGGRGCLEALIGEPAVCAQASAIIGRPVDLDEAAALARDGDHAVAAVFAEAGRTLGRAVGNLVNVLSPKVVILAGEGSRASDLLRDGFHQELSQAVFDGLQHELEIVIDMLNDEAWARGAAGLLLSELFEPNLRPEEAGRPSLGSRSAD